MSCLKLDGTDGPLSRWPCGDAAHFYGQMDKIGTICFETNYAAFEDYNVNATWIKNWYQMDKITYDTACKLFVNRIHMDWKREAQREKLRKSKVASTKAIKSGGRDGLFANSLKEKRAEETRAIVQITRNLSQGSSSVCRLFKTNAGLKKRCTMLKRPSRKS